MKSCAIYRKVLDGLKRWKKGLHLSGQRSLGLTWIPAASRMSKCLQVEATMFAGNRAGKKWPSGLGGSRIWVEKYPRSMLEQPLLRTLPPPLSKCDCT